MSNGPATAAKPVTPATTPATPATTPAAATAPAAPTVAPDAAHAAREALKPKSNVYTAHAAYLAAADAAAKELNGLGSFNKVSEKGQPSLDAVVNGRGQGGKFYSLENKSETETVAQLNIVAGLKESHGRKFSPELKAQIIEFQKMLVEKDPVWKALEAELQKSGKTLIDGKVGPLTINALTKIKTGGLNLDAKTGNLVGQAPAPVQ